MKLRSATLNDEPAIRNLQNDAILWLTSKGTNQWQPAAMAARGRSKPSERGLRASLERGEVYVIDDDENSLIGTFTIDNYADPDFWLTTDAPDDALYIHRMVVDRRAAGHDLGGKILDWATHHAYEAGKHFLRLDAWRTNKQLHTYYLRHGFRHIRTVDAVHRGSGALFERQAQPVDLSSLPWQAAALRS